MTLSCYIIDDEPIAIECLEKYVRKTPILQLVGTSTNPFEAIEYLQKNEVSFLFVDINMEELNGLELMKMVDNKVVLTTAHEEYALRSYDFENTVDYLLKPITYDRFLVAVKKVMNVFMAPKPLLLPADKDPSAAFPLKTPLGKKDIPYDQIDFIKAGGYYSTIFYGKEKAVVPIPLKDLETLFPATHFTRIHKSYMVNRKKVKSLWHNKVLLQSNITIPIGRTFRFSEEE